MKLYNSLSKKVEEFNPLRKNEVTIYVCGITPYDTTHLGHAFTYISFDALIKYLKFKGFKVIYTQNVTDINDRDKDILQRAKQQNISWQKLTHYWTKLFLSDMQFLNWTSPDNYLKASEQIPSMISLVKKLLNKKLAYIVNNSVYLDISKIKEYGKLSKLSSKDMLKLAKEFEEDIENPEKNNPLDITLWRSAGKNTPPHIPSFNSPFGKGRPGWHIECSAMSTSTLGKQIDIHGGGRDLRFPHHEAELAQSEGATGKIPFANFWLHTGTVFYKGEKMSKSKGNLIMISKLSSKFSSNAIRFLLVSNHWHSSWEFFEKDLKNAQKKVDEVERLIKNIKNSTVNEEVELKIIKILDTNFDTPKALDLLVKLVQDKKAEEAKLVYNILGFKI